MRTDHPSSAIVRFRTPTMLAIVALLQLLDWRSTLVAPSYRHETNRMLNWLGQWIGFSLAVSAVKASLLLILLVGYLYWRRHRGMYEMEFGVCLGLLIVVYGGVVANNYLA